MKTRPFFHYVLTAFLLALFASCRPSIKNHSRTIFLKDGWQVQQSSKVKQGGVKLSTVDANIQNWYQASVPSTIMGVLTSNGVYKDIFVGDNLKKVDTTQFNQSWWYRKSFQAPELTEGQHAILHFDGISYYANIWLNGQLLASKDSVFGAFRRFQFDVSNKLKQGENVLAVEIFRRQAGDFGVGFVDWNPKPPDQSMGLWRNVYLKFSGNVSLINPEVTSDVNLETLDEASLIIKTGLKNYSHLPVRGVLKGKFDGVQFEYPVQLKADEQKVISITDKEISSLHIKNPRLWWCNNLGKPNLYQLHLQFVEDNVIDDSTAINFGIRDIQTFVDKNGHKGFKLNGKKVLIKGAGWADDLFLRDSPERNETQVQYVKDMNLNTIRFEGFWGTSDNIYSLCDKYGIMVMVGWSCQWEWENLMGKPCDQFGGIETEDEINLIANSLDDQVKWLRNHPSIITWFVGSDKLPRPELEERYKSLLDSIDDRSYIASAGGFKSSVSGSTGVKMNGPYQYVGPNYWYIDSVNGGAFGFNTETGPEPQIPVMESIKRMIPADKLWPINDIWNFHCAHGHVFGNLDIFNKSLENRYGKPQNLHDYVMKSGAMEYEAMRGMFEAFRVNLPQTTGLIQWMLNSAWPAMYWQLYDYYLLPTPAYYAIKKANAPVQLIYDYGDNSVYAVNEKRQDLNGLKASVLLYGIDGKEISSKDLKFDIDADFLKATFATIEFQW